MAGKRITKSQFIASLAEKSGLDKKQAAASIDAVGAIVAQQLGKRGPGEVLIPGLLLLSVVALAALGILTFLGNWNNLVGPLIIMQEPSRFTLTVALRTLVGLRLTDYGALMAGTVGSVIPILVIYLAGARRFIAGIAAGSLQGV